MVVVVVPGETAGGFLAVGKGGRGHSLGAHQGGHATARFLEGFLEGSLTASA